MRIVKFCGYYGFQNAHINITLPGYFKLYFHLIGIVDVCYKWFNSM